MRTLQELLKQEPVFLNDWAENGRFGVISDFEHTYISKEYYESIESTYANKEDWIDEKSKMDKVLKKYEGINILFASYGSDNYEGDAWVLFEEGGELFEVSAGHCSCYGLEGQWEKEKVVLAELENRITKGTFGVDDYSGNEFNKEIKAFLGVE